MATKYWVALQGTATVPTANTATNWNTAADGSGSAGVPGASDDCVFGHPDSVAGRIGFAECAWDIAQVNSITVHDGYQYQTAETSNQISFTASSKSITHASQNFEKLGFVTGMWITVTGSTSNNGTYHITNVANNIITILGSLTDEAKGATVSIVSESSIDIQVATLTLNTLSLDGTIKNSTGSNKTLRFEGSPGTNNWYITNGENAQVLNQDDLTYNFNSAQTISFDDGPYPQTTVTAAANLQWDYKAAPTSPIHKAVSFYSINVSNTSATAVGTLGDPRNDFKKVFKLLTTGFTYTPSRFDAGFSTWHFKMSGSFSFPVTGSVGYGAGDGTFTAAWYNVVLDEPDTVGRICSIPLGKTLNVNSLTVESGAQLIGADTKGSGNTSTIVSVNRPTINGAWNFSQVTEGIYSSIVTDTYPFTPAHGAAGRVQLANYAGQFISDAKLTWTTSSSTLTVDGKLTVTGLIDPTGMQFTRVGANPGTADTIWVNSSGSLMFGTSAVGGGGGGSGTVTNIATSAPITGGAITTTGTIGISAATTSAAGSMSSADKTKLDGITAGATPTNTANVEAAGALMDSEVTNLADVKAFNPADYATAAQGVKADSALQPGSAVAPGDPVSLLANDLNYQAAGDPVSNLVNDAGYLTSDATSTFCIWNDIGADITGISLGTNQLINNWTYTTGNTGLRDAMSSGVFTCTAALAGTYLIISKIQYKSGTLSETNNVNYKLQNLNYHRAGGGTPSGGILHNFARHMNASFYNGYILETQFILTIADTDTFGVYAKIATSSGSGNFKVASGSNAMTSLTMIKIA